MHGPSTSELETDSPRLTWSDYNERGLASAAGGTWDEATACFSGAADALAAEHDVASHEALALVLNNLAHGCYRVGRVDDAIRHAQRACALRVALVGEDAVSVARARSDLAVMLASTGRAEEALALITRAIAGIERSAGDEALQLAYVLENAARLAMASGQPSTAEPYLLRLHALHAVHELPTDRADALLAGVAHHRTQARLAFGLPTSEVRSEDVRGEELVVDIGATTGPSDGAAVDADAVITDDVIADAVIADAAIADAVIADAVDELTLTEPEFDKAPRPSTVVGLDFDLVELAPVDDAAITPPVTSAPVAAPALDVLGFEVRYGTQIDEEAAELADLTIARPASTRIPTPTATLAVPPPVVSASDDAPRALRAADDGARERRLRRPIFRLTR